MLFVSLTSLSGLKRVSNRTERHNLINQRTRDADLQLHRSGQRLLQSREVKQEIRELESQLRED